MHLLASVQMGHVYTLDQLLKKVFEAGYLDHKYRTNGIDNDALTTAVLARNVLDQKRVLVTYLARSLDGRNLTRVLQHTVGRSALLDQVKGVFADLPLKQSQFCESEFPDEKVASVADAIDQALPDQTRSQIATRRYALLSLAQGTAFLAQNMDLFRSTAPDNYLMTLIDGGARCVARSLVAKDGLVVLPDGIDLPLRPLVQKAIATLNGSMIRYLADQKPEEVKGELSLQLESVRLPNRCSTSLYRAFLADIMPLIDDDAVPIHHLLNNRYDTDNVCVLYSFRKVARAVFSQFNVTKITELKDEKAFAVAAFSAISTRDMQRDTALFKTVPQATDPPILFNELYSVAFTGRQFAKGVRLERSLALTATNLQQHWAQTFAQSIEASKQLLRKRLRDVWQTLYDYIHLLSEQGLDLRIAAFSVAAVVFNIRE
jgi:hypothetical protein